VRDQVSHPCKTTGRIMVLYILTLEPGYLSRYSIWLRAGRPGDRCSIPGRGKGFFLYPPILLLYNRYRGSLPGGKARPGRDFDHSSPSSAEVVNV
jgi:hypothetical protein